MRNICFVKDVFGEIASCSCFRDFWKMFKQGLNADCPLQEDITWMSQNWKCKKTYFGKQIPTGCFFAHYKIIRT